MLFYSGAEISRHVKKDLDALLQGDGHSKNNVRIFLIFIKNALALDVFFFCCCGSCFKLFLLWITGRMRDDGAVEMCGCDS